MKEMNKKDRNSEGFILDVLVEERDIGYLDPGIDNLLVELNSISGIETTSTCTGRITLVEGKRPWIRGEEGSRILYKTHDPVRLENIVEVLSRGFCNVWLKVSGPILHIRVVSAECAKSILLIGRQHGFKHSGIISMGEDGIILELMSGAQFTAPIRIDCTNIVNIGSEKALKQLVELANMVLQENKQRFHNLVKAISTAFSDDGCS